MPELLPLFPLQLVVFPRTQLPLHIFEERYKEMVGEAIADHSTFGIVLAKDGGIVSAGCTVSIDKVLTRYPDGRLDVLTIGARRFEITGLNESRSFLQGQVEFFDDDKPGPGPLALRRKAMEQFQALADTGAMKGYPLPEIDDPELSFQLAQAIDDVDFQNALLRDRSEANRLQRLVEYLVERIPREEHTQRMKELAPRNGHGGKH